MAIVKRCDRCGKIYDILDINRMYSFDHELVIKYSDDEPQTFNLCDDCVRDVSEFIKGGEKA